MSDPTPGVGASLEPTPSTTADPEPPSTAPATPDPAAPAESSPPTPDRLIAVSMLLLGAIALYILFRYLDSWRSAYLDLSTQMIKRSGRLPGTISTLGTATSAPPAAPAGAQTRDAPGSPPATLAVKGPPTVAVGQPAMFSAWSGDTPAPATWRVLAGDAVLQPTEGAAVELTAAAPGAIALEAMIGSAPDRVPVPCAVVATKAPEAASSGSVPIFGEGYGAFMIAIVGISVAGALTAIGWLPGAALATLLGTVVSYFFVQRQSGS